MLRRDLAELVTRFLEETKEGEDVPLDHLADQIFPFSPTQGEIDEVVQRLERHGRTVGNATREVAPQDRIRRVLDATRALKDELGRSPTEGEVAERSGLSLGEVRATRLLLRVMHVG